MSRAWAERVALLCTVAGALLAGAAVAWPWFGLIAVAPLVVAAWLQFTRRGPTVVDVSASSWSATGGRGFEYTIKKAELGQGKIPALYQIHPNGSLELLMTDFRLNAAGDMVVSISVDSVFDARIVVA